MRRAVDFGFFQIRELAGYGPVVERGPAVVVVPRADDGRIWLARISRPAVARSGWELPGGAIEAGEGAIRSARRELLEECGLRGGKAKMFPTRVEAMPGMGRLTHRIVVLWNVRPVGERPVAQRSEGITRVRAFTHGELGKMVGREIFSMPTIAALACVDALGGR